MNNYYAVLGSAAEVPEPQGHGQDTGIAFNFGTIGFSILNLLILFIALRWILFKPITKIMDNRTEKIKKNIVDAENNRGLAEQLKNDYQEQLNKLKAETSAIINNAHQKAQTEAEEILKKAKQESEIILTKAREQGQVEVQKALENVKNQVAGLALMAATKVIQKNMDNDTNRKLVEKFIDEVGAA